MATIEYPDSYRDAHLFIFEKGKVYEVTIQSISILLHDGSMSVWTRGCDDGCSRPRIPEYIFETAAAALRAMREYAESHPPRDETGLQSTK